MFGLLFRSLRWAGLASSLISRCAGICFPFQVSVLPGCCRAKLASLLTPGAQSEAVTRCEGFVGNGARASPLLHSDSPCPRRLELLKHRGPLWIWVLLALVPCHLKERQLQVLSVSDRLILNALSRTRA